MLPNDQGCQKKIVLNLANERAASYSKDDRQAHVGYYLIGKGLMETRRAAKIPQTFFNNFRFKVRRRALFLYLSTIFLATTVLTAGVFYLIRDEQIGKLMMLLILGISFISFMNL